jgi:cytoskeletal protein CcmA (bactofilin family)
VTARFVEIGNRGQVQGPIRADEIVVGKNAEVENLYGKSIVLRSGATANNIYGGNVVIESHCRIDGEVQYTNELRQCDQVSFAQTPKRVDTLPV